MDRGSNREQEVVKKTSFQLFVLTVTSIGILFPKEFLRCLQLDIKCSGVYFEFVNIMVSSFSENEFKYISLGL